MNGSDLSTIKRRLTDAFTKAAAAKGKAAGKSAAPKGKPRAAATRPDTAVAERADKGVDLVA